MTTTSLHGSLSSFVVLKNEKTPPRWNGIDEQWVNGCLASDLYLLQIMVTWTGHVSMSGDIT